MTFASLLLFFTLYNKKKRKPIAAVIHFQADEQKIAAMHCPKSQEKLGDLSDFHLASLSDEESEFSEVRLGNSPGMNLRLLSG